MLHHHVWVSSVFRTCEFRVSEESCLLIRLSLLQTLNFLRGQSLSSNFILAFKLPYSNCPPPTLWISWPAREGANRSNAAVPKTRSQVQVNYTRILTLWISSSVTSWSLFDCVPTNCFDFDWGLRRLPRWKHNVNIHSSLCEVMKYPLHCIL